MSSHADKSKRNIWMPGCRKMVEFLPESFPEDVECPMMAAVDVGSVSVGVYLLDGLTGERLAARSMLNPQVQYGMDVIQRCGYALENGPEILSGCIRSAVNVLLREASRECGRSQEDIVQIVMVGNSYMQHLFLEISPRPLVSAPHKWTKKDALRFRASEYGLMVYPWAQLCWLPGIGGFVGADTVGCLLASGMDQREDMTLLVDIGVNVEIVLGNRKCGLTACFTAVGAAFEGVKIVCGMRGGPGAIDQVYLEEGEMKFHVMGGGDPIGICGSGLLDAVACLLKLEEIDQSGRLKETYYFTRRVFLTQQDIREVQLVKGAVAAGIRLLCMEKSIRPEEIRELLLAGTFGYYLNPDSASIVGMFPRELQSRITTIGNAAGEGAQIAAANRGEYDRCSQIAKDTQFFDLTQDPQFGDIYISELGFPAAP